MSETRVFRELNCFGKRETNFSGSVCVRTECERDVQVCSHLQDVRTGIHFLAVFAEASGVDFDGDIVGGCRLQEAFVKVGAILGGNEAELFAKIGVADDIEEL